MTHPLPFVSFALPLLHPMSVESCNYPLRTKAIFSYLAHLNALRPSHPYQFPVAIDQAEPRL